MRAAKNPPSFILVDRASGEVVYTKRATGVGSEAIRKCVEKGRTLANRTGRIYFVYLDIMGVRVGMKMAVPMAYALGITEEIHPTDRSPARRCCSAPELVQSGQGVRCLNCQSWRGGGAARSNPRRAPVRRNIYTFNNPPSGPADPTAARELELYVENDADLYRQQYIPIVKNLMLKRRKGVYNRELAVKLFMYLMESGAKKYIREFVQSSERGSLPPKIDTVFNKATREMAARTFRDHFEGEAELGNWDHLLVRPTTRGLSTTVARKGASSEFEMDMGMFEKGYRYKLIPKSRAFEPLYAKSVYDVPKVMREYPHETFTTVDLSPPRSAHENPGRVRKNIYTFNNPKKYPKYGRQSQIERAAGLVGLLVTTWAPGDGQTHYRFFKKTGSERYADYHQGGALYTAHGRKDALSFIVAYRMGRNTRRNPLTRAESGQELKFAREAFMRGADLQRAGQSPTEDFSYAQGIAGVVGRRGTRAAARVAERVTRHIRYNPVCSNPVCKNPRHRHVRKNPLLQTIGLMANPPISAQWDRLSQRQRLEILGFVGFGETAGRYLRLPWRLLSSMVRQALEEYWLDSTASRGTTRRRMAPVGANPLTRRESGQQLRRARGALTSGAWAASKGYGETATYQAGRATGISQVVREAGPKKQGTGASKIIDRAQALRNPGVRLPKPGTRLTVAQALDLAERLGNRELVKQCHAAMKLQKAANRGAKCVIWKVFPMGSKTQIDSVVALTHYGDSPETMYKPPPGSKKGNHMYRHNWGEKGGKQSVPLLASPDGKMLMMPLEGRKVASDWLRH